MFSPVPVPIPAAKTSQDLPTKRVCVAYCVDGRMILSDPAESVSALLDRILPDQERRQRLGEPIWTHLVIFEPVDMTIRGVGDFS